MCDYHRFTYTCRAAKAEEVEAFHPLWRDLDWDPCESYPSVLVRALHQGDFRVVTRTLKTLRNEESSKEELLGCLLACIHGKTGYIGYFSMFPQYRGQGIGRLLFEDSLDYLRKAGCTSIGLDPEPAAAKFYLKYGFKSTGGKAYSYTRLQKGSEGEEIIPDGSGDVASRESRIIDVRPTQDEEAFNDFIQRDFQITSFERNKMLKKLFSTPGWHIFQLSRDNAEGSSTRADVRQQTCTATSYLAVQPDMNGVCLGPMYASTEDDARSLLDYVVTWYIRSGPAARRSQSFKLSTAVYGARTRNLLEELGWSEEDHYYERMWLGPEPAAQSKLNDEIALVIDSGLG